MFQLLQIALRNLAQHRRRTFLLGGAIAAVTTLLVVLVGLSNGIQATMLESATTLMTGHINVAGFYKFTAGQSAPIVTDYEKVANLIREKVPELDFMTQRGRGWAKLVSETGTMQVGVGGIDIANEKGFRRVIRVKQGNIDDLAKLNNIMLFEEQAKKLDLKVGDQVTLSSFSVRGSSNSIDLHVAVVAENVGLLSAWNTFVSTDTLRAFYQLNEHATGAIMLYLKNMRDIPRVEQNVRRLLTDAGYRIMDDNPVAFWFKFDAVNREDWTGQKLDITNWEDEISFIKWTLTALNGLTGVLTFVLLVIIAVGIMNTMWISIRERTREIGTLRAVGMHRRRVLLMFMLEAFSLALIGTASGAIFGIVLCALGNAAHLPVSQAAQMFTMRDTLAFKVSPATVLFAMALITFCTSAIALIPSFLAARLKPVTAMSHIG